MYQIVKKKQKNDAPLTVASDELEKDEQILNEINTPNKNESKEESSKSILPSSEKKSTNCTETVMKYDSSQKIEKEASTFDLAETSIETDSHQQTALTVNLSPNKKEMISVNQEGGIISPSVDADVECPVDITLLHAESSVEANRHQRSIFNVTFSPIRYEDGEKVDGGSPELDSLSQTSTTAIEDQVDPTTNLPASFIETNSLQQTNVTFSPIKNEKADGFSVGIGFPSQISTTVTEDHVDTTIPQANATFTPIKNENAEAVNDRESTTVSACAGSVIEANSLQQTTLNITFSPMRTGNEENSVSASLGVGLLSPTSVVKHTVDKHLRISSTPRIGSVKKLLKRLGNSPRGTERQRPSRGPQKVSHVNMPSLSKSALSTAHTERIIDDSKASLQRKLVMFSSPIPKGKTPAEPRPRVFKFGAKTNDQTDPGPSTLQESSSTSKTKLPNFSLIHQKMFSKMESIDETVQRRMERSKALSTKKEYQAGPKEPTRKEKKPVVRKLDSSVPLEQPKRILQSRPNGATSLQRHQEMYKSRSDRSTSDKRSQMLRGVRLNRRFDLQMKFRYEQVDHQE